MRKVYPNRAMKRTLNLKKRKLNSNEKDIKFDKTGHETQMKRTSNLKKGHITQMKRTLNLTKKNLNLK